MRKRSIIFVFALSQLGYTDCGEAIRDDGFDLWCGEELCAWKLERGAVKRVPSWNEGDSAVELVGTDVAIAQLSPVNSYDGSCLRFELIANVEENAEVRVNIDVQSDGSLELSERLPTSHWKPLSFLFSIAKPYDAVRFEITKQGSGRGVIANIGARIVTASECSGLPVLDPGPRRDGALCNVPTDCASGLCMPRLAPEVLSTKVPSVCVACDYTAADACGAGQVCGLAEPLSLVLAFPVQCVATAAKQVGEPCIANSECGTNICYLGERTFGSCSTCNDDSQCPTGQYCLPSGSFEGGRQTRVCGAGEHMLQSGAPCASHDDCASWTCLGTKRNECDSDGRACYSGATCPLIGWQNGACTPVGVQGGTCE